MFLKEGMTLEQFFHEVKDKNNAIRQKQIAETGSDFISEDWLNKQSEETKEVLQCAQWIHQMTGKIK